KSEVNLLQSNEAAKTPGQAARCQHGCVAHRRFSRRSLTTPMTPFGATVMNTTSTTPTINRLRAEEIVTVAICWNVPSSSAPMTGPSHVAVPPINGMAIALTAIDRLKAVGGST